jgi:hypothetical protein
MKIEKSVVFLNDLMESIKAQFEPFTFNKEGQHFGIPVTAARGQLRINRSFMLMSFVCSR